MALKGQKLIKYIEPAVGIILEGMVHGLIAVRWEWSNGLFNERFAIREKLDERV